MMSAWQSLPEHLSPIAFAIGSFSFRFYSLFWIVGFFFVWFVLSRLLKRDGVTESFRESLLGSVGWIFFGALVGGRLGYALLYAPQYFWQNPMNLFSPFENGVFTGLFGMSFFGGVIGVLMVLWFSSSRSMELFFRRADYFALVAPIALFFGRIGNFLNGELFGRVTVVPWGMYFPLGGEVLRHPSQLYEAFFEGILLFLILWRIRKTTMRPGMVSTSFLFLYGLFRFFIEFFRAPDFGANLMFGLFTEGQLLSVLCMFFAGYLWRSIRREKSAILGG
ncbi:MAG: prolipoprotein diacylglyceryl transferase [Candidatus Moraniibacteriota bacterium]